MGNADKITRKVPDLMALLDTLSEQAIELAAIRQAAKDFVTLKEVVKPFNSENRSIEIQSAYNHLKELVY